MLSTDPSFSGDGLLFLPVVAASRYGSNQSSPACPRSSTTRGNSFPIDTVLLKVAATVSAYITSARPVSAAGIEIHAQVNLAHTA